MITDFLKSMFPVDLNPPPGVPYIWCGVWGVGRIKLPIAYCLLNKVC